MVKCAHKAKTLEERFDAMVRLAVVAFEKREMEILKREVANSIEHKFSERHKRRMSCLFASLI